MELLNSIGIERPGDTFGKAISANAKLLIISSYFTVYAYGELRAELLKIDKVRLLLSEPTFIEHMVDEKGPRESEVARRKRETGIGGSGLELKLRNSLNQCTLAREYAERIRSKGVFKSVK